MPTTKGFKKSQTDRPLGRHRYVSQNAVFRVVVTIRKPFCLGALGAKVKSPGPRLVTNPGFEQPLHSSHDIHYAGFLSYGIFFFRGRKNQFWGVVPHFPDFQGSTKSVKNDKNVIHHPQKYKMIANIVVNYTILTTSILSTTI